MREVCAPVHVPVHACTCRVYVCVLWAVGSDLVEQLQQAMHDGVGQRRGGERKGRRDVLKIQITRVLALAAEHGCFHHSQMARTERGEISPVLLEFIDGIK